MSSRRCSLGPESYGGCSQGPDPGFPVRSAGGGEGVRQSRRRGGEHRPARGGASGVRRWGRPAPRPVEDRPHPGLDGRRRPSGSLARRYGRERRRDDTRRPLPGGRTYNCEAAVKASTESRPPTGRGKGNRFPITAPTSICPTTQRSHDNQRHTGHRYTTPSTWIFVLVTRSYYDYPSLGEKSRLPRCA